MLDKSRINKVDKSPYCCLTDAVTCNHNTGRTSKTEYMLQHFVKAPLTMVNVMIKKPRLYGAEVFGYTSGAFNEY